MSYPVLRLTEICGGINFIVGRMATLEYGSQREKTNIYLYACWHIFIVDTKDSPASYTHSNNTV
jgi:hypothetical protein